MTFSFKIGSLVGEKFQVRLTNGKFVFTNMLKTKCNSVREIAFIYPFLHTVTFSLLSIFKGKIYIGQKNLIFWKQIFLYNKVFKLKHSSCPTLHVSLKKTNLKKTSTNI